MGEKKRRQKLNAVAACRCGSGRAGEACCFNGTHWVKAPAPVRLTATGKSGQLDACYMRAIGSCCGELSREHLISETILKEFSPDGKGVTFLGFPWMKGEVKSLAIKGLVAKCLCKTHNSALSPLDQMAGFLFRSARDCISGRQPPARRHLISGHDFERWLLKTMMALAVSGNLGFDNLRKLPGHLTPELDFVAMLENPKSWPAEAGVYYLGQRGDLATPIQFTPLIDTPTGAIVGLRMEIFGLIWAFVAGKHARWNFGQTLNRAYHRPYRLVLCHPGVRHVLEMSWEDDLPHPVIEVDVDDAQGLIKRGYSRRDG